MRREAREEAQRWLIHARDEFQYYVPTRYPNGLPRGVPSRFYTDPEEAQEAMELARAVLEMVEERMRQS